MRVFRFERWRVEKTDESKRYFVEFWSDEYWGGAGGSRAAGFIGVFVRHLNTRRIVMRSNCILGTSFRLVNLMINCASISSILFFPLGSNAKVSLDSLKYT